MNVPVANTCRITNQKTVFISPGLAEQQQNITHNNKKKVAGPGTALLILYSHGPACLALRCACVCDGWFSSLATALCIIIHIYSYV